MNFEDLKNPELQEKLKRAKTADELAALAKAEGVELAEGMLESMSGGGEWNDPCGDACDFSPCETKYCPVDWSS